MLKPPSFLSLLVMVCGIAFVLIVTYNTDYLPEPVETIVFNAQDYIEDKWEDLKDEFDL